MGRRTFGTVRKLPSGRWQGRYRDSSGLLVTAPSTFVAKGDANAWLARVQTDLSKGVRLDAAKGRLTFEQWADEWRSTAVDLRPSTRARDESYLRSLILPTLGQHPVARVDHLMLRRWVADLQASGLAPATIQKAGQIVSKVLRLAADAGGIAANPMAGVKTPTSVRAEMRFLEPAEVAALADAIDPRYTAAIWTAAYCGLRAGELFGLRAGRLDLERRTIDVAENLVEVRGQITFGPPKTRAGRRVVPVPSFVADALALAIGAGAGAEQLVFTSPTGQPIRLSLWRRRFFEPAVVKAGLAPLRVHDLRHTAVSLWLAAGVTPLGIARRAGHSSVSVVLDRYGHLISGSEDAANERLEAIGRSTRS